MVGATAFWGAMVIPAIAFGVMITYANAKKSGGSDLYIYRDDVRSGGEMFALAVTNGIGIAGLLTMLCVAAAVVGAVMTFAIERKDA